MASRICFILTCLIVFAGCYTQLRAPRVHREQRVKSPVKPSEKSVQRFEYYYYNYCNPSDRFYRPYRPYRPYRRHPVWNTLSLIWKYSSWASVHDPWWRGWSPRILVPHIIYAPTPAVRPQVEREQVNPRPRIRYTGVRDAPASASSIRRGSTTTESTPSTQQTGNSRNTKTESTQQTGNSRNTKTQSAEKSEKKEEKSETREEKRSTQRRRGEMR